MRFIGVVVVVFWGLGCGGMPGTAEAESESGSQTVTTRPSVTVEPGHGVDDLENCKPLAVTVPESGLTIPFQIDPGSLLIPYLAIEARTASPGDTAANELELDEAGSLVQAGWDVCVGQSNPSCFANLEFEPGRAVRSFTLRVTARSSDGRSPSLQICLFEGAD
jgi:hypothetical protein